MLAKSGGAHFWLSGHAAAVDGCFNQIYSENCEHKQKSFKIFCSLLRKESLCKEGAKESAGTIGKTS
jgi:hypothetical protein